MSLDETTKKSIFLGISSYSIERAHENSLEKRVRLQLTGHNINTETEVMRAPLE